MAVMGAWAYARVLSDQAKPANPVYQRHVAPSRGLACGADRRGAAEPPARALRARPSEGERRGTFV